MHSVIKKVVRDRIASKNKDTELHLAIRKYVQSKIKAAEDKIDQSITEAEANSLFKEFNQVYRATELFVEKLEKMGYDKEAEGTLAKNLYDMAERARASYSTEGGWGVLNILGGEVKDGYVVNNY